MEGCYGGSITNCYFGGNDVAVHISNSTGLYLDNNHIEHCEKGVVLDDCWDTEIVNTYIDSVPINTSGFKGLKLKKLTVLIRHYMFNA